MQINQVLRPLLVRYDMIFDLSFFFVYDNHLNADINMRVTVLIEVKIKIMNFHGVGLCSFVAISEGMAASFFRV
jgi:hypothetical protein